MDIIFDQLQQEYGAVTFEAFINLLVGLRFACALRTSMLKALGLQVEITEDQTSPAQLRESFRGIAADKVGDSSTFTQKRSSDMNRVQPFVTELDLRVAHLPQSAIDYLRQVMPSAQNGVGEPEYDYEAWLDNVFAQ